MKLKKAIGVLETHNRWRRGEDVEPMLKPSDIGGAIDLVVEYVKNNGISTLHLITNNINKIRLIWKCEECEDIVVSYSHLKHDMNYCECSKSAVDLEEYYQRDKGKVKYISRKKKVKGKWVNVY